MNPLGVAQIAAFNAVSRVDGFVLALSDGIAGALMMFVSQNRGAGKGGRVVLGLRRSLEICAVLNALCAAALLIFPREIAYVFLSSGENDAAECAASFMRIMAVFYMLAVICNPFQGFFRGVGMMKTVLRATYIQIPVRVGVTYALARSAGINAAAAGIAAGWLCMAAYQLFEYHKFVNSGRAARPGRGR